MSQWYEMDTSSERVRNWRRKKRMLLLRRAGLIACAVAILVGLVWGVVSLLPDGDDWDQSVIISPVSTTTKSTEPTKPPVPTLSVNETVQEMGGFVDAQYAVLVDVTESRIIAQKAPNVRAYPASITKMMTLLVAVENIADLEDTFEITYAITDPGYQQGASMAGFKNEEQVRMVDLLYGCILPSGADATAGLSACLAGSEEAFAAMMNQRAEELGLKDTHFTNTSGLHGDEHYTTAHDMALILMEAMKNETCRQVLSAVDYTAAKTPQNPDGLTWRSTMFERMYGDEPQGATIVAGKTGYTYEAKHTMASYAKGEDSHDYVIVTMGGSNKYNATYDHINILSRYVGGATDGFYPKD